MNKLTLLKSKHPKHIEPSQYYSYSFKSFGIWMDGKCSWLSSEEWDLSPKLDQGSTLAVLVAYHKEWGIQITCMQEDSPTDNKNVIKLILKNQTENKRAIKFVCHFKHIVETAKQISFVSPVEHAILQSGEYQLSLLSSRFNIEKESQLAVGRKEAIWCDLEGRLAFAPLCRDGRESMIVTKMEFEPWQETYGSIWEVYGQSEEIYAKHYQQQTFNRLRQAAE